MSKPKNAKSPWRSTKRELPLETDIVLCRDTKSGATYLATLNSDLFWVSREAGFNLHPTHWMPIPPLPEDK